MQIKSKERFEEQSRILLQNGKPGECSSQAELHRRIKVDSGSTPLFFKVSQARRPPSGLPILWEHPGPASRRVTRGTASGPASAT